MFPALRLRLFDSSADLLKQTINKIKFLLHLSLNCHLGIALEMTTEDLKASTLFFTVDTFSESTVVSPPLRTSFMKDGIVIVVRSGATTAGPVSPPCVAVVTILPAMSAVVGSVCSTSGSGFGSGSSSSTSPAQETLKPLPLPFPLPLLLENLHRLDNFPFAEFALLLLVDRNPYHCDPSASCV